LIPLIRPEGYRKKWLNVLNEVTKERKVDNSELADKKEIKKLKAISKFVGPVEEDVTCDCYPEARIKT
jgi:hypothetical protein